MKVTSISEESVASIVKVEDEGSTSLHGVTSRTPSSSPCNQPTGGSVCFRGPARKRTSHDSLSLWAPPPRFHPSLRRFVLQLFYSNVTCHTEEVVTTATLSCFPCRYIQPLRCNREVSYPMSLSSDNTPGRSGLKSRPQTRYPD